MPRRTIEGYGVKMPEKQPAKEGMTDAKKEQFDPNPLIVDPIIPPWMGKYSIPIWLLIFGVFTGGSLFFASDIGDRRFYLGFCLPLALGFLTVPLAFRFCYARLKAWSRNVKTFASLSDEHISTCSSGIDEWITKELSFFFGPVPMYFTGVITAALALLAFQLGGYPVGITSLRHIFSTILLLLSAFVAGLGLHAVFCCSRMIWRLGAFRVVVKSHKFGVLSTGRTLLECYFAAALVWSVYTSTAILGSPHFELKTIYWNYPLLIMAGPTIVAILTSFVACQVPLHARMVEFKQKKLARVELVLDQFKDLTAEELTKDVKRKVYFFENRTAQILALPEWPFGFTALLGAVASSFTPALLSPLLSAIARAALAAPLGGPG